MKKQIYLIRHSIANEPYPGQRDVDRELNEGGSVRAMQLANYLQEKGAQPDAIYTSKANRAQSTADYLAEKLLTASRSVTVTEDIYESSVRIMVGMISNLPENQKTIMIVGHNPILQYVGEYLCGESLDTLEPGGYYHLEIDIEHWSDLTQGNSNIVSTTLPTNYALG